MDTERFPERIEPGGSGKENGRTDRMQEPQHCLAPLFDLQSWDQLAPAACEKIGRLVADRLPDAFRFSRIETCQCGSQKRSIALIEWNPPERSRKGATGQQTVHVEPQPAAQLSWQRHRDSFPSWEPILTSKNPVLFALIPGDRATLGYNRGQPFTPEEKDLQEWQMDSSEANLVTFDGVLLHDLMETFPPGYHKWYAFLDQVMLPLRTASIRPFLLEVEAKKVSELLPTPWRMYHIRPNRFLGGKRMRASCQQYPNFVSHSELVLLLNSQGFRLPTSDEWEYARAAGTRSLFYWGEALWSDLQYQQNAFGLLIENDSYRWEFCGEVGMMRGGDGGCAACGGEGRLAECITAASAYASLLEDPNRQATGYFRRAYSLPMELVESIDWPGGRQAH